MKCVHIYSGLSLIFANICLQSCSNKASDFEYTLSVKKAIKYEKQGDYGKALRNINTAIAIDSSKAFAFVCRGIIKSSLKNESSAIADFSKAIQLDKTNTAAYFQKGVSFSLLDKEDSAILYFNLAINTKQHGDYQIEEVNSEALAYERQYIPMEVIRYNRGLSFYNIKKDSLAFEDFSYSMKNNYKKGSCFLYMGVILAGFGKIEEGCKYLNQAISNGENEARQYLHEYCK